MTQHSNSELENVKKQRTVPPSTRDSIIHSPALGLFSSTSEYDGGGGALGLGAARPSPCSRGCDSDMADTTHSINSGLSTTKQTHKVK